MFTAEELKEKLRCGGSGCPCRRGVNVHCPNPFHSDTKPSFSVSDRGDKVVWHCQAGCDQGKVTEIIYSDKYMGKAEKEEVYEEVKALLSNKHYSVALYAEEKQLPADKLRYNYALTDDGKTISMPYFAEDGTLARTRLRKADKGFLWKRGDSQKDIIPYGVWMIKDWEDYVFIVEGESDSQTLWVNGINALGIPGATMWKPEWDRYVEKFNKVYVMIEPDIGGDKVLASMERSSFRDKVIVIAKEELHGFEDVSDMWLDSPKDTEKFKDRLREAFRAGKKIYEHPKSKPVLPNTEIIKTSGSTDLGEYVVEWPELRVFATVTNISRSGGSLGEIKAEIKMTCDRITKSGLLGREVLTLTSGTRKDALAKRCYEGDPTIERSEWRDMIEFLCDDIINSSKSEPVIVELSGEYDITSEKEWIVKPFIEKKNTTSFFGFGGSGKSYFTILLAILASQGINFGSRITTNGKKRGVLMVDYETSEAEYQRRRVQISKVLGVPMDTGGVLHYTRLNSPLENNITLLSRIIKEKNIELIFIDSFGAAIQTGSLAADAVASIFNKLDALGPDVTAGLVDHANKSATGSTSQFGSIYKVNFSRSQFELKNVSDKYPKGHLVFTLTHHKYNNGSTEDMMGFVFVFHKVTGVLESIREMEPTEIESVSDEEKAPGEMDWEEASRYFDEQTSLHYSQLARLMEKTKDQMASQLGRWKRQGKVDNDNKGTWWKTEEVKPDVSEPTYVAPEPTTVEENTDGGESEEVSWG